MMSETRFPLRVLVTDPSERFQLSFAEQGAAVLAGFSGVQTQSSARGLIINGVAERDISAAVAMLRVAIPAVAVGAVEVVYLDQGSTEPWVRVRVTTPADRQGDVVAQLVQRRGLIEGVEDTPDVGKIVVATAPLARLLGYDQAVAATTGGIAIADYEFIGYRPIQRDAPDLPLAPDGKSGNI
jgi:predicted membrane GTPase involved in stress response